MPVDLDTTYLHIDAEERVREVPVTDDFWFTIDHREDLLDGRLVMRFTFDGDWPTWEVHPHGDELIVVTEGAMVLRIEHEDREERVELGVGDTAVVPRGRWHTGDVADRCVAIFATPGRGTQNRDR